MGPLFAPDDFHNPAQGWAVLQSGGYGADIPGGPATGPWNTSLGAGIRIAILDSGIDATHPDLAPNLALNLSEIDQSPTTGLPSACDDGSPQDQQGHGTFVASLAAAAVGPTTGLTIGVAPQATLLNIKVLQRTPTGTAPPCLSGEPTGLLSWVLSGINDAVTNHADIISLSLGTYIDTTTGDGAGWKSAFDAVTHAAAANGTVIVAALGNDALTLNSTLLELPAQSRDVLAVAASTNPACAEDNTPNATCTPGTATLASYSNQSPNALLAPGGNNPSPGGYITGACTTGLNTNACFDQGSTPYIQATGTSASAALTAGAAAILRATHPTWTVQQITAALLTTKQLNLPAALQAAP